MKIKKKIYTYINNKHKLKKKLQIKILRYIQKKRKRKCVFVKKTMNNFFLTLTNIKGEVITSFSYGKVKIFTKKRRRSPESYKD